MRNIEIDHKAVGRRLRELRGVFRTQGDVAKDCGLTRAAVGMYEQGQRLPRPEIMLMLADYYGTDVGSIFFIRKVSS